VNNIKKMILAFCIIAIIIVSAYLLVSDSDKRYTYTIRIGMSAGYRWIGFEEEGKNSNHFGEFEVVPYAFIENKFEFDKMYMAKIVFEYTHKLYHHDVVFPDNVISYEVFYDDEWKKAHEELNKTKYIVNSLVMENKSLIFDFSDALDKGVSSYKSIIKTTNITNPTNYNISFWISWRLPNALDNKFFDLYIGYEKNNKIVWEELKHGKSRGSGMGIKFYRNSTTMVMIKMVMHGSQNVFIDGERYNATISLYNNTLMDATIYPITLGDETVGLVFNCEVLT